VVGDFDGLGFAVGVGDVAVGDVGVAVNARENRVFKLVYDGIVASGERVFKEETRVLEPLENPFGPKVLPM
jgi:hypothetical protein